jgi:hypothetical protein
MCKKKGPEIPALKAMVFADLRRLGWGIETERIVRESCQRPNSETVAPGGWGAECPEPVVEARPRATPLSIAF